MNNAKEETREEKPGVERPNGVEPTPAAATTAEGTASSSAGATKAIAGSKAPERQTAKSNAQAGPPAARAALDKYAANKLAAKKRKKTAHRRRLRGSYTNG